MSVQAMGWVLDQSEAEGSARLVLLSLANHASPRGANVSCGLNRLGREARLSRSTVIRAIDELVAEGDLLVYPGHGVMGRGGRTNRYELPRVPGWVTPLDCGEPASDPCGYHDPNCGQSDTTKELAVSPEPEVVSETPRSGFTRDTQTRNRFTEPREGVQPIKVVDGVTHRFIQGSGWVPPLPRLVDDRWLEEEVNA